MTLMWALKTTLLFSCVLNQYHCFSLTTTCYHSKKKMFLLNFYLLKILHKHLFTVTYLFSLVSAFSPARQEWLHLPLLAIFTALSSHSMWFSWIKPSPVNHYKANIYIYQKTLSCPANVRCINNSMKETTVVEKLSKQLRPPPLPTPLRTMNVWQRLLTVLKICFHSSVVTNPGFWLQVAFWKEGLSPASQADMHSHVAKSRSVESDSNQDLPPPHGLGLGGCQWGQGHMQWSNIIREKESESQHHGGSH